MAAPTIPQILAPLAGEVISGTYLVQWSESVIPDVIEAPFLASTAQVFAPDLAAGVPAGVLALPRIESMAAVHAPEVIVGSAGVVVYAAEDFTGTNNAPLNGRSPTWDGGAGVGGVWVKDGTGDLKIYDNRLAVGSGPASYPHQDEIPVADHRIELQIETLTDVNGGLYIRCRDDRAGNGYMIYRSNAAWTTYKRVGGAQSALKAGVADDAVAAEIVDYAVELENTGASEVTIRILKNGVLLDSVIDATSPHTGLDGGRYVCLWVETTGISGLALNQYRVTSLD